MNGPSCIALALTCQRCGRGVGVRPAPVMTRYHTVDDHKRWRPNEPVPPNLPISQPQPPVCWECEEEWAEHWTWMWEEYHSSIW